MVERRMAPLSKQLVGLILPYDTFGSHLNASRKTVDVELEKKNFAAAGKVLSEIWHGTKIDGHPVFASYVEPAEHQEEAESPTEAWRYKHVRQSQYALQIKKCDDVDCCKPRRSPNILKDGFLPAPFPFIKDVDGFKIDECNGRYLSLGERTMLDKFVPRDSVTDSYCPSVKSQIKNRTCQCGYYSSSIKSNKEHKQSNCCIDGELSHVDFEEEENTESEAFVTGENIEDDVLPILSLDTENNNSIRFLPN